MTRSKLVTAISPQALELLKHHDYPGNARELENIIEHAFVLCPGSDIEVEHLPKGIRQTEGTALAPADDLAHLEARFLVELLQKNGWHRAETARELGIHRTTLLRKIRKHGIVLPKQDGRASRRKIRAGSPP